jgi:hypothetical protein
VHAVIPDVPLTIKMNLILNNQQRRRIKISKAKSD